MEHRKKVGRVTGAPPYWLLARDDDTGGGTRGGTRRRGRDGEAAYYDVLVAGSVLPLFGSEDTAVSFLGCLASENRQVGWRATEAGAGELLTMLSSSENQAGPCAGVEEVAFDPPEALIEEGSPDVPTVGRRVFMDRLLGRGGRWSSSR